MSRDLFSELKEGMRTWGSYNNGKVTLREHKISSKNKIELTPTQIKSIRDELNISQAVFAHYLHAGVTTYQNWEQGKAKPNAQAVLLLRLVQQNPQALQALENLH